MLHDRHAVDINCDLGEGFGRYSLADDAALLEVVTSANVACGFHAGDPRTMSATVDLAARAGVGIGAHPGFPDLVGFGRRDLKLTSDEIETDVLYQMGALSAFVHVAGQRMQHVSIHGQLGNLADKDRAYADPIARAVQHFDDELIVITGPGELADAATRLGLRVAVQLFVDRAYNDDGSLASRHRIGAVITDPDVVAKRAVRMVVEGTVTSVTGRHLEVSGQTLCLHSDTVGSVQLARRLKAALVEAGIEVTPLRNLL
jgi:UPF0271 protein